MKVILAALIAGQCLLPFDTIAASVDEKGKCSTVHFSNGTFDVDDSAYQCNQEQGFYPLIDPKDGSCTCEKGFESTKSEVLSLEKGIQGL